jgi:hypothetical protein
MTVAPHAATAPVLDAPEAPDVRSAHIVVAAQVVLAAGALAVLGFFLVRMTFEGATPAALATGAHDPKDAIPPTFTAGLARSAMWLTGIAGTVLGPQSLVPTTMLLVQDRRSLPRGTWWTPLTTLHRLRRLRRHLVAGLTHSPPT